MTDKKYKINNYVLVICILVFIVLGIYNLCMKDFLEGIIRLLVGLGFSMMYIENRRKSIKKIEE